ncbi:hypothetical protein evm_004997 [Chilo suppressalis]|nr:hypothetical protein evm_004997 [Chilo suppressalis]
MSFICFTRKKQDKRKSLEQSSISAGNSPLRGPRLQRPISQNLNVAPRTSAYKGVEVKGWECGLCRKELVEPRLLACLHSFCTSCLQGLHQEGEAEEWSEVDQRSVQQLEGSELRAQSCAGSAGSGYESDPRHSGSDASWDRGQRKYGIFSRRVSGKSVQFLLCPTCSHETPLPIGGIAALPLNYILLRKMVAAGRDDSANVLCDLCNSDNKAESKCDQCLVSVCSSCSEAHVRHKATSRHSLRPLDLLPVRHCSQHPRAELSVYCATCQQVICRDCCIVSHSGHALSNASRAAGERARQLSDACERARHVPEHVERAIRIINSQAYEADSQAARVEGEVAAWAEQYRRAVEAHARALCLAAADARQRHRLRAEQRVRDLQDCAKHAVDAVKFAEEVLSEAREDELLSLSNAVSRRLEQVSEAGAGGDTGEGIGQGLQWEVRFAPHAPVAADPRLVGRLLTRAPSAMHCRLNTDGLQDLRVDCQHEAILELRDENDERIWCGGELVSGYYRRRDSWRAPAAAHVRDVGDGTYALRITPRAPGAYLLAITVDNKPIKGSPFPMSVRVGAAHTGQFHCCAFCSSGGRRDARCGCGALMPGGYSGCGHGHAGWPGARHWSCCGSTRRAGACTVTPRPNTTLYQFSL